MLYFVYRNEGSTHYLEADHEIKPRVNTTTKIEINDALFYDAF